MEENRKRNKTLTVRLTERERNRIISNAMKAGLNITDYIVKLSLETPIHVAEDVKPMLLELKRIGNNLNQISMKINAGAFQSYNFQEVIEMQRSIYEALLRIGGSQWQP